MYYHCGARRFNDDSLFYTRLRTGTITVNICTRSKTDIQYTRVLELNTRSNNQMKQCYIQSSVCN